MDRFEAAVEFIRSAPTDSSRSISDAEKLQFYGLYKQATVGDCTTSAPWAVNIVKRKQWDAWHDQLGKTKEEAQDAYVQLLDAVYPSWFDEKSADESRTPEESDREMEDSCCEDLNVSQLSEVHSDSPQSIQYRLTAVQRSLDVSSSNMQQVEARLLAVCKALGVAQSDASALDSVQSVSFTSAFASPSVLEGASDDEDDSMLSPDQPRALTFDSPLGSTPSTQKQTSHSAPLPIRASHHLGDSASSSPASQRAAASDSNPPGSRASTPARAPLPPPPITPARNRHGLPPRTPHTNSKRPESHRSRLHAPHTPRIPGSGSNGARGGGGGDSPLLADRTQTVLAPDSARSGSSVQSRTSQLVLSSALETQRDLEAVCGRLTEAMQAQEV